MKTAYGLAPLRRWRDVGSDLALYALVCLNTLVWSYVLFYVILPHH